MAIFRECKHSFQIVQALFGKSASTVVFFTLGRVFSAAKVLFRCRCGGTDFSRCLMSDHGFFSTTDDTD